LFFFFLVGLVFYSDFCISLFRYPLFRISSFLVLILTGVIGVVPPIAPNRNRSTSMSAFPKKLKKTQAILKKFFNVNSGYIG